MTILRQGVALFAALITTLLPLAVSAQASAATLPPGPPGGQSVTPPQGTTDCFQYYHFGSVQANISPTVSTAVSGTPVTFQGTLKNNNTYPVVDGALYIKVFRIDSTQKNADGPAVVDQFFVRDGIDLAAGGSMPLVFSWDIPSFTPSGTYEVATFFTTSKKYNLLGLSFTDDVVGNTAQFTVSGETKGVVEFDKSKALVNGQSYHFAAFPPVESATSAIPVTATVVNHTGEDSSATINWKIYSWDAGQLQNLVSQSQQSIQVPKNGSAQASITVTDTKYPVYLVIGTLNWQNTQSIVNVRFVRGGVDRLRINFPSITSFPLTAGTPSTLFSCLYNSGNSVSVPNGRLDLSLTDDKGKVIDSYTYTGDVTGAMMAVAHQFTPTQGYNVVNLDAKLYQGSTLVDESHLVYDCNLIDPKSCLPANQVTAPGFDFKSVLTPTVLIAGGLIILLLIGLIWGLARRKRSVPVAPVQRIVVPPQSMTPPQQTPPPQFR